MSYALYYEATRKQSLTEQEKTIAKKIIEKYCSEYPFKRKAEDFCMYDENEYRGNIIFNGSTKLPGNSPETLFEVANYWLKCLTEITKLLVNAEWNVTFDDVELVLDAEEGWRFPTDEEYEKRQSDLCYTFEKSNRTTNQDLEK